MKKTTRTFLKTTLATSLAVVATGSTGAMAAWTFVGSDTLTEVVNDAIGICPTAGGTCTAGALIYNNTGSGAAESALIATIPTQRIAPMSRNFKQTVLTGTPALNPALKNIIGLDAAVMVEKNVDAAIVACPDLAAALDPDQVHFPQHAALNTMLGLILGGKDGKGDTASCQHPDRLAAIDALSQCFGGVNIAKIYRRDDRSGTADTFKEKLRVDRFCSGRAPGLIAGLDNNMANDDSDPVRRRCVVADATHAQTVCTRYPLTTQCTTGSDCTQGLTVALSQNDPGAADITTSIAQRTRLDTAGSNVVVGFAGRAGAKQGNNTAPTLNTISANDFNVRANAYILSRRLFLNWGNRAIGTGKPTGPTADDIAREAEEKALFDFVTNPDFGGRIVLDPVMTNRGFLPCTEDSSDPSGPGNLCSLQIPPPAAETTSKQCIPAGVNGNGADICCANPAVASTTGVPCGSFPCAVLNAACTGAGVGNCCVADGTTCTNQGTGNFACN